MTKGWWATHTFKKRSCRDVIKRFCGWNEIEKLYNNCRNKEQRLLVLTLIKTGGRISEVLRVTRDMFVVNPFFVNVYGMTVLKRGKPWTRMFPIKRDEPFTEEFISEIPDSGAFFDFKYDKAYKIIVKLDSEWFPHRFRGERASQLVMEYHFDTFRLMKFFQWKKAETPTGYAMMDQKELEDAMS